MLQILTDEERDAIGNYLKQQGSLFNDGFYDDFYIDTVCCIFKSKHHPDDIEWIGTSDGEFMFAWKDFKTLVSEGYGDAMDEPHLRSLTIVFKDNRTLWCEDINGEVFWSWDKGFDIPTDAKILHSLWY